MKEAYFFNLAFFMLVSTVLCSASPRIDIYTDVLWGISACENLEIHPGLAGSCALLHIGVSDLPTGEYSGEESNSGWPVGLTIKVGTYQNNEWTERPELLERLSMKRWTWHFLPEESKNVVGNSSASWVFQFVLPPDLIGETLWFQADYETRGGLVRSEQVVDHRVLMSIVAPCSEEDHRTIQTSFIRAAYTGGDYPRTIQIADSLVSMDWRDIRGLSFAAGAARRMELYEKELQYLDMNFEANRRISPVHTNQNDADAEARYFERRREILEQIENQQQD
ncbi:hypothetical protein KKC97_12090 [bacterium]|nr:hypothetical protein [bacterium]